MSTYPTNPGQRADSPVMRPCCASTRNDEHEPSCRRRNEVSAPYVERDCTVTHEGRTARDLDARAATLAESWINGRSEVATALESAGVDGAALALALATSGLLDELNLGDLAAYMRRRAEQRASDASAYRDASWPDPISDERRED